ncbi:hypothetical protein Tco_0596180 [Tanacetum coccineum]
MSKLLYTHFTKLVIDYLLSLNKSITCRSYFKLYSSQDDHPITKLLSTTNAEYKFGMEVPDAMISDANKKKAGYKYYMAKKVESEKAKIIDKPKEQHVYPIKSGRGKCFKCYGDQVVNIPNKLKKDVVPRKTRSLTIAEEAVVGELANSINIYVEWGQKLKGHAIEDPAVQSLLDLQKGSKANILESLRKKKQPVAGEGSSAAHNKYYSSSDTASDATLYSSSSDKSEEKYRVFMHNMSTATPNSTYLSPTVTSSSLDFIHTLLDETPVNELTDFISHPVCTDAQTTSVVHNPEANPELTSYISGASEVLLGTHVDVLATKTLMSHDNQDPPNNRKGENKKKHRKDVGEPSSISSSTEEKYTTSITKHYATRYYKEGIKDRIPKRWIKEVRRYHFEALNVRRSDDKEYEFSYADLPRLSVNDVEDMYLLQVQDKLHHLPLEFVKDFNISLLMVIRRTVIKNRVEDIQLGLESYQRTLNLTKPIMFFKGIDQRIPFTMAATHKGVAYLNQYNIKSLMKLSEVKKFSDGTLSSKEMLKKIDEILKHIDQLRRLEEYVGGRPKTVDPRTFIGALALALKNWRHYIYGIRCTITRASNLYKLKLPRELGEIHNTFHVLNLKKCVSDENLVIPLDEIRLDDKLYFIEEPIEIMDHEVKKLKQSRMPIVKVRWNSQRGPEFT